MNGKIGFGKDEMCSYKLSHNSAVHQFLSFNYTVPATGVENLVVTLRLYTPYGITYWDDVSVDITIGSPSFNQYRIKVNYKIK